MNHRESGRPNTIAAVALLLGSLALSSLALAHHSFAMFDNDKMVTLEGTLHAVEFRNPHGWVWVKTTDAIGATQLWGLEGGSLADFTRQGYTKKNLVVGTRIKVTLNPLRDGRTGGRLRKMEFPDGDPRPAQPSAE